MCPRDVSPLANIGSLHRNLSLPPKELRSLIFRVLQGRCHSDTDLIEADCAIREELDVDDVAGEPRLDAVEGVKDFKRCHYLLYVHSFSKFCYLVLLKMLSSLSTSL